MLKKRWGALITLLAAVISDQLSGQQSAVDSNKTAGEQLTTGRIIDLTHSFDRRTIYWPTETGFDLIRGPAGVTGKGYYYSANRFSAAEHGGTHIDAPVHFFEGRQTVDQISLKRLIGEAAVIEAFQRLDKSTGMDHAVKTR